MEGLHNCMACPRGCGADRTRGQRGYCGADCTVWVARAALHHWEEPPISGTRGSGAVFFAHCALGCVFCQNRQISRRADVGKPVTAERLAEIFLELEAQGAHNINLVTGSHYAPQLVPPLRLAREQGLAVPVVWNSSGYETADTLRLLDGLVNIYLPDYKYHSSYYAARYSRAADYPETAQEAITEMVRQAGAPRYDADGILQTGVIVRHLMLPGLGGDTSQVLRSIAERWGGCVLVSLLRQYTPVGTSGFPELNRRISDEEYQEAVEQMQQLGLSGFIQDSESISESFIPSFSGEGV
ncbi:radical SAM protein [Butyricicoccus sp. 1XD8-22]|nr:radical SAM protein [Butyricicoccus sp. 1XD8-22]RKJ82397.1 radical SAM protein [Butyricicoccus sp. 1XD8-22]